MIYRHELKYLIHQSDYAVLKMRVAGLLKRDPHAGMQGFYSIRSLYFDDYFNNAYNEKDISILEREKYRIRIYNTSKDPIHLERKIKRNNYVKKDIASLSEQEVGLILRGEYDSLKKSTQPLQKILYYQMVSCLLRPRVLIDYEREPYIFEAGNVRINFDRNVRAGISPDHFFKRETCMFETLPNGFVIMEVKFSEFLPRMIQDLLPTSAVNYTSMSKYMLGCDKTLIKRQTDY